MKIKWWQRLLCKWFCPRFHEDMPEDEPGTWVACSILVPRFRERVEKETEEVEGLRNAYEVARWLALKLDWKSSHYFGVEWAVRKADAKDP